MCCITTASFSTLINGYASYFFHAERGLRQGYPLSLLLFLIVMEGLTRLISFEKGVGRLMGLNITGQCILNHLLFMDDVLIFLKGDIQDHTTLSEVLQLFSLVTRMEINIPKSTITFSACSPQELHLAYRKFPFQRLQLEDGLKYLSFHIKSQGYKIANWTWLVSKVERILNNWSHRILSRVGHLVLIKFVLEATLIYWMSLAWIPQGILSQIQRICCNFLWKGHKEGKPFSWVKWSRIVAPKKLGGWGLKDLPTFSHALAAKLGWLLLNHKILWIEVVTYKYIWPQDIMDLVHLPSWNKKCILVI